MGHEGQTGARQQGSRVSQRTVTPSLRQHAWWVMRRRLSFTLPDLLSTLANGTERDAAGNLGKYLCALEKSGIVKREAKRQAGSAMTSNGYLRYQLVVNTGRKAPVWRARHNIMYDPNSNTVYPINAELRMEDRRSHKGSAEVCDE